jgi:copper homeostasis protein
LKLELATFTLASCRIASELGVHRLELCEDYTVGGVTPSLEFFEQARKIFSGKIMVMIRPRAGTFIYSEDEFNTMLGDLEKFKKAGADGFVSGFFNSDHTIHENQLNQFVNNCEPFPFTFHRSFDEIQDWKEGLDVLIENGCTRLLTSGDGKNALEGLGRLKEMMDYVKDDLIILPGGGIRSENLQAILDVCSPKEIHTAGILKENLQDGKFVADRGELLKMLQILS